MDLQGLFEQERRNGLFADYDVCVMGPVVEKSEFSGGVHVDGGSYMFDVASLTKACTHLLLLKMFASGELNPTDSFGKFVNLPQANGDDRELWHFLCYTVQSYGFDYESLRDGTTSVFKEELIARGFGHWAKRFKYDNIASAYLALLVERIYGCGIEDVFHERLLHEKSQRDHFLFHPVSRGIVSPQIAVPTSAYSGLRGIVHDPLSFSHQDSHLSVAGVFSTAKVLCEMFHGAIEELVACGLYEEAARNQLLKLGIAENSYGLGFDIPFPASLGGYQVEDPLLFAGWTGCRLFFSRKPRLTICFLTNRVLLGDDGQSRQRFSGFFWSVVREVLKSQR